MHLLKRVILQSAAITACSGNPVPEVQAARLIELALASRCPVVGMSLRQITAAWGKPDSVLALAGDSVLYFDGPERTVLGLRLRSDTITGWEAHGMVDHSIAREQPDWSIRQAEGFKRRAAEYIRSRNLPPARRYALWRSCPQVGMPEADLVGSWGKPQERQVSPGDSTVALLYGFGVEGQHDRFIFRNDSLVSVDYVGLAEE